MYGQKTLLVGLLALSLALAGSPAWAQRGGFGPRGGGGGPRGGGWARHLKSLNLSQPQVQKIQGLRADMRAKAAPLRAQLRTKHQELRALWLAKAPSRAAIIAKHNEIDAIHRQLRDLRIGFKLQVFGLLTPAQRTQLQKSLAAQPAGRRFGPMKMGRGRGGPRRGLGGPRQAL